MRNERLQSLFNIKAEGFDYVVALAGNPNTGKSTLFNAFTGLRQHTGNWPGKTVTRAEGTLRFSGKRIKVVDLPGTYSLTATGTDEEIARDFILFGMPDCTVIVVDATNVERNLNLALQILAVTDRAVVCLNLMDEAERRGISIDADTLAEELGIPVIPCVARDKKGVLELAKAIDGVATGVLKTNPRRIGVGEEVERALAALIPQIEAELPGLPNARWVALRLLDGDETITQAFESGEMKKWLVEAAYESLNTLKPQEVVR